MKKKETLWDKISWNFYLFRLGLILKFYDMQRARNIRKYCNKGRHKIKTNGIKVTHGGHINGKYQKKILFELHYYECSECGSLFFVTIKDKEEYEKYLKFEAETQTKFIKMMIEDSKRRGKCQK